MLIDSSSENHRVRNWLRRGIGSEVHTDGEQRPHILIAKKVSGRQAASVKNLFDHEWKGVCNGYLVPVTDHK